MKIDLLGDYLAELEEERNNAEYEQELADYERRQEIYRKDRLWSAVQVYLPKMTLDEFWNKYRDQKWDNEKQSFL